MKLRSRQRALLIGIGAALSSLSVAQPLLVAPYQHGADITGIIAKTETGPADDAVLVAAPSQLSLRFPSKVRLVKLTLRNELHNWVDISFRYDPRLGEDFVRQIPTLAAAEYYTADWAILGMNDLLIRGSFSFSFGAQAERPSVLKEAEAMLLDQRTGDGDPSTRFVTPPRTEIIIDIEPRQYDPPFVIELEASQGADASEPVTD